MSSYLWCLHLTAHTAAHFKSEKIKNKISDSCCLPAVQWIILVLLFVGQLSHHVCLAKIHLLTEAAQKTSQKQNKEWGLTVAFQIRTWQFHAQMKRGITEEEYNNWDTHFKRNSARRILHLKSRITFFQKCLNHVFLIISVLRKNAHTHTHILYHKSQKNAHIQCTHTAAQLVEATGKPL